jgi:hypothetical protein
MDVLIAVIFYSNCLFLALSEVTSTASSPKTLALIIAPPKRQKAQKMI